MTVAQSSCSDRRIRSIAIVGGGTAGWMAAAALVKFLDRLDVSIRLIESEQIGKVGVGEATLPSIVDFIRQLGIGEDDLVRQIRATFKLGIGFRDWTCPGDYYFHPLGPSSPGLGPVSFSSYWLKSFLEGEAERPEEYSIQAAAAAQGKFMRPVHAPNTPLNKIAYALHFDAQLFAEYLRSFAEPRGVKRIAASVRQVKLRASDGLIESLLLDTGETVAADFFIDCTGFQGLLIEGALKTGYEDWSRWLPCDRAVVVSSARIAQPPPYCMVTAREAGWQWRIPLQHRTGDGYVYSSAFTSDEDARNALLAKIPDKSLAEPRLLRFVPGRRKRTWNGNCLALGLSSGFLEPLEATSIHLIQRGIAMLLKFFPTRDFEPADIGRYNKTMELEFGHVRDFLLMHYSQTERTDAFWTHCREIAPTDSLKERIELFKSHGRILREDSEVFPVQSWLTVMIGQNIRPRSYDPMTDAVDATTIRAKLNEIRRHVGASVARMPSHADFIAEHCAAR